MTVSQSSMLSTGICVALAGLAALEVFALANRIEASTLDPAFCGPGVLHTTVEPPDSQLTRDYVAIRIMLKDPHARFEQIKRVYAGDLHASPASRAATPLLQSSGRVQLLKADHRWSGSLRGEVQRLDRERGTQLAQKIDAGIQSSDAAMIEAAFREAFTTLLDDLLTSIEQRLDRSAGVGRSLQHARRYYSESLDAYLSIHAAPQAARASLALDAMARAADGIKEGKPSARDWFSRERANFLRAIREGMNASLG